MSCKNLKIKLINGHTMPLIGLGTWQVRGGQLIHDVIDRALEAGYRSFDTAAMYGNEKEIGDAFKKLLPKYNLKREDIFVTTKLSPNDQGTTAKKALQRSLSNLDLSYLDLYLIHWPGAWGVSSSNKDNRTLRIESWNVLVEALKNGQCKAIGVSNYTTRHLNDLFTYSNVKPDVNQVEWHPHFHEDDLKELCDKEGIHLQAYSSLGGNDVGRMLRDKHVNEIAKNLSKTPSQILLRWALQQGVGIIPKARSKEHIVENISLDFVIPDADINLLNNLKHNEKISWDPNTIY